MTEQSRMVSDVPATRLSRRRLARPASRRALFTTSWDDGVPLDVRVADVLDEFGLAGTFYASTGPGGARTIGDESLARIAARHELGNHGRTHTPFTALPGAEIAAEAAWGQAELSRFGDVARIVAPPGGKVDRRVVGVLQGLGFSVRSGPILGTPRMRSGILEPTFMFRPQSWTSLARNVGRRRALPAVPLLLAWVRGGDFRECALRLLRAAVGRVECVHVWGHAEEVERLQLWEALSDLLAAAARLPVEPIPNSLALEPLSRRGHATVDLR